MVIEHITDATDIRIAVYRDLKDKQLVRDGLFIIEGKFILETMLLRSHYQILSIFIAEDRLLPLKSVLKSAPEHIPVYITSSAIMAEIAGFDVHRGILAAGISQDSPIDLPAYLKGKKSIAVLSNISNPDNIGAIFRNAAGLGIECVLLDEQCCSPLYRKAIRVSMGASLVLPWIQSGSILEILKQVKDAGFAAYALSLQSPVTLDYISFAGRSAFVFGEEAHGLPSAVQALCTPVKIPMSAGTDSLNVAATSAIVFHAARNREV